MKNYTIGFNILLDTETKAAINYLKENDINVSSLIRKALMEAAYKLAISKN